MRCLIDLLERELWMENEIKNAATMMTKNNTGVTDTSEYSNPHKKCKYADTES